MRVWLFAADGPGGRLAGVQGDEEAARRGAAASLRDGRAVTAFVEEARTRHEDSLKRELRAAARAERQGGRDRRDGEDPVANHQGGVGAPCFGVPA